MELEAFFRERLPRLEPIELASEPESMATMFVGGEADADPLPSPVGDCGARPLARLEAARIGQG